MLTSVISTYYYLNFFSRIVFLNFNISDYFVCEENYLLNFFKKQSFMFIVLLLFFIDIIISILIHIIN